MSANGEQHRWWDDPHEVIGFARVLVEADQLGGCQHTVISFFETPWDWDDEHRIWCEAGRPHRDSNGATFETLCTQFNTEIADDHAGEYASPLRWQAWSTT